jgi:hypothetical protein
MKHLTTLLALALLAACGAQSPNAALPQALAQSQMHRPSGSSGDLLYVVSVPYLTIMSYPQGKVVTRISGNYGNSQVCSDRNNGNVFVVNELDINEYAHGGTTPIATLTSPSGDIINGCAVDSNGNLAATTYKQSQTPHVLIWAHAQGYPASYSTKKIRAFGTNFIYDGSGNLFLNAENLHGKFRLVELKSGQSEFTFIQYPKGSFDFETYPPFIQWDGKYFAFLEDEYSGSGNAIFQVQVTGRSSQIVNTLHLLQQSKDRDFELYNGVLLGFYEKERNNSDYAVAVWNYPKGGRPFDHFYGVKNGNYGNSPQLTLSVAPSRSRVRQ